MCIGSPATSYLFINEAILNAYGITINDVSPYYMNYAEASQALADGDIDAAFQTGGYPVHPLLSRRRAVLPRGRHPELRGGLTNE